MSKRKRNVDTEEEEEDDDEFDIDEEEENNAAAASSSSSSKDRKATKTNARNGGTRNSAADSEPLPDPSMEAESILSTISWNNYCPAQGGKRAAELDGSQYDQLFGKALRLVFLQCICNNRPVKKKEIRDAIGDGHLVFPIINRVNEYLRRKFGMELVPQLATIESERVAREIRYVEGRYTDSYVVVSSNRQQDGQPAPISLSDRNEVSNEIPNSEATRRALSVTVLAIVLLQDTQCATFDTIKTKLCEIDYHFDGKVHPVFGEWEPLVSRFLVDEGILEKIAENNTIWYYAGPSARVELGVPHVYDFAHRIVEGCPMNRSKLDSSLRIEHLGCKDE